MEESIRLPKPGEIWIEITPCNGNFCSRIMIDRIGCNDPYLVYYTETSPYHHICNGHCLCSPSWIELEFITDEYEYLIKDEV